MVSVTNMSYDVDNDQRRKVLKVETRLRIRKVVAYKSQNIMTFFEFRQNYRQELVSWSQLFAGNS